MDSQSSTLLGGSILSGLVSTQPVQPQMADEPVAIPLKKIHKWTGQPRQYFSEASVSQLAASFRKHGFKGTLVVRPHPIITDEYQLIAGERRLRAAEEADLRNVLCFVGEFSDEQALDFALGENLHREDLTKIEEALGILRLIETRYSINQEIAIEIISTEGHSDRMVRSNVTPDKSSDEISEDLAAIIAVLHEFGIELQTFRTAHLPTLKLPETLKKAHLENGLSYLSAKALAQLKDERTRDALLKEVLDSKLSVRKVRERVKEILNREQGKKTEKKSRQAKSGAELTELRAVVSQLNKSRKLITDDASKMRKVKKILAQLKELLPEAE